MKAVAYRTPGPIDREDALQDITLETPEAEGRDLLVKIDAATLRAARSCLKGSDTATDVFLGNNL